MCLSEERESKRLEREAFWGRLGVSLERRGKAMFRCSFGYTTYMHARSGLGEHTHQCTF